MALEADVNYGFKGEVTSAETPIILGRGVRYCVEGATDLAVTAGGSGDRAVTVAAGSAWGDGVLSKWDTGATLNGAAVSSGSRWDTVVIRREWTPLSSPTGTATLMLLQGGSSQAISVNRTTDAGVTTSDQPLALVRFAAGQTAAQQVVDLRAWAGAGGGYVARDVAAREYLDTVGTQLFIGSTLHFRRLSTLGTPEWYTRDLSAPDLRPPSGGWGTGLNGFVLTIPGFSNAMLISGHVRQMAIYLRNNSAGTLAFSGNAGHLDDRVVAQITADDHKPAVITMVDIQYRNGSDSSTYGASGYIRTNGEVVIIAGAPGTSITQRTASNGWSMYITGTYLAN